MLEIDARQRYNPLEQLRSSIPKEPALSTLMRPVLVESIVKAALSRLSPEKAPEGNKNFEPFIGEEKPNETLPNPEYKFINNYGGIYASRLELNRTAIERFISLSRIAGNITLSSLQRSRTRGYMEINSDASVSSKRGLTIGQHNLEEDGNPYYRINATRDGWMMQVNGEQILQDIHDKPSKKITNEVRFAKVFNGHLRHALKNVLTGEKLTSAKDIFFDQKLATTLMQPAFVIAFNSISYNGNLQDFILKSAFGMLIFAPLGYKIVDFLGKNNFPGSSPEYYDTNSRQGLGTFLPPVRIEDVLIGLGYLDFKGRTLVRLNSGNKNVNGG